MNRIEKIRRRHGVQYGVWIAIAVLSFDLAGTFVAWYFTRTQELELARDRFNTHVDSARLAITKRMLDHELVLRGGLGMFIGSHKVERQEWHDYISTLSLDENFPGIQGVGFSKWIEPEEKAAHIAEVRAEGFPEYRIWPDGVRPHYTSIMYLEPFVKRNLRAFGYDMLSDPIRREAMSQAIDLGVPRISGKVRLVQETDTDIQHGILMLLPLYRKNAHPQTVEERRAAIAGFVYSPYRMNDLMSGILGDGIRDIDVEIYDGNTMTPQTILYDADNCFGFTDTGARPLFASTFPINVYGRDWTLCFRSLPAFDATLDERRAELVLAVGVLITLLLAVYLVREGRQTRRLKQLVEILEATPDIVGIASPEGQVLYVNGAGRMLLGIGKDEDVSQLRVAEFHPPAGNGVLTHAAFPAAVRHGMWKGEIDFLSRDGRIIPASMVLISHKNQSGKVNCISTISRDITDFRKAEEQKKILQQQLTQSEKMAAIGTMVAGIAHEINNPLTGILGYADLILSSVRKGICRPDTCKQDVEAMASEATRCSRIVRQLLTFGRKYEPLRNPCRLDDVLREAADFCAHQIKLDGIELEVRLDANLPETMADPHQIQQVFFNIIRNGHQALKECEAPRRLIVSGRLEGDVFRFSFRDSGPGIPKEHLTKIFDPFFTTKDIGKGNGLGLSICFGIIAEHEGRITVDSAVGQGSTFTVELPFVPPSALGEFEPKPPRADLRERVGA